MTSKADLLAEAADLGITGVDQETLNRTIQELIDDAKAAVIDEPQDVEAVTVAVETEPTFTLEQLQPYSEQLFGVPGQVLVGAQSAGTIPAGKMTKGQAQAGIDQYMAMPVEQVRRD